jgi:hypothetical protein
MRLGGPPFYATFRARESLVRAGYADTPAGLDLRMSNDEGLMQRWRMCTLFTQGRAMRLCVTRAVHLVRHPAAGFVRT